MEPIHKLVTKYGLILAFSSLIGQFWFYLGSLLFPVNAINFNDTWRSIPNYTCYAIQVLICILLVIDIRKYKIKLWLIPLIGLFYPLVGVCIFLILFIYSTTNSRFPDTEIK